MFEAQLSSPTDWDGWRGTARRLMAAGVAPGQVAWSVEGEGGGHLFGAHALPPPPPGPMPEFRVPRAFIPLAETVILHRDPARFVLLHALLLRLQDEPRLLEVASDADVARLESMARSVRRDQHKMKAFVRFREIADDGRPRFVAWFEPDHHIVEATAPFFQRRFAAMRFTILTPDRCADWDGQAMRFAPGVGRELAPAEDRLEDAWRVYYASIFNPARLKVAMMRSEMPKKYWGNLPEAPLIPALIASSRARTDTMIEKAPTDPKPNRHRPAPVAAAPAPEAGTIAALRADAAGCRACPLWAPATQTVFGEGPDGARVVFVGEQPGDREDLAGRPFVGPAGQLFDRALDELGIDRLKVYVTNAVKHFKFEPRGKLRLHKTPAAGEVRACRPWLERELDLIRPDLVVAMGATAVTSLFGKSMAIGKSRGALLDLPAGPKALVTVHPSYLLRVDDAYKAAEYARFLEDLRLALPFLLDARKAA